MILPAKNKLKVVDGINRIPCPSTGVHFGVPEKEYRAWDAVCQSDLKKFGKLIRTVHTREQVLEGMIYRKQTASFSLGSLVDDLVFNRDKVLDKYVVSDAYKTQCDSLYKKFADHEKEPIAEQVLNQATAIAQCVSDHPVIGPIFKDRQDKSQACFVWDDIHTGLRCKARIDHWGNFEGDSTIFDLKTTSNFHKFYSEIFKWGYHIQAAFYLDGAATLSRQNRRYVIVPVNTSPLEGVGGFYEVGMHEIEGMDLDSALRIKDSLIQDWFSFFEKGEWVGRVCETKKIRIPEYEEAKYAV
ncbi:Exodeoxyribonuclease 8 [Poriferisphaera corsica]|uniref:Exodeoxyribonuclease 8 n=1 Tax=Poriferisphaera corsica TaxID=2528020 RepID=A0A517YVS6_9BACT|nr:PD-(D/E)XK nuclease-like domain-containing protein [Poriferisphaera corsica]QDU34316.1 Exodeoxyribonuclease 8 [Poriferisphaera corsica]